MAKRKDISRKNFESGRMSFLTTEPPEFEVIGLIKGGDPSSLLSCLEVQERPSLHGKIEILDFIKRRDLLV